MLHAMHYSCFLLFSGVMLLIMQQISAAVCHGVMLFHVKLQRRGRQVCADLLTRLLGMQDSLSEASRRKKLLLKLLMQLSHLLLSFLPGSARLVMRRLELRTQSLSPLSCLTQLCLQGLKLISFCTELSQAGVERPMRVQG